MPVLCGVRSVRLWSLLLLPSGLVVSHLLRRAGTQLLGATSSIDGNYGFVEGLACLAVPLILAVLGRAILAGLRNETAPVRFELLAPLQVACFLAIEVAEHANAGSEPSVSLRNASLILGVMAQVVIAWLLCAIVRAANRLAARTVKARTPDHDAPRPSLAPPTRTPAFAVAMSSLSRRGPPCVRVSLTFV